jgi:hypothetical protein
MAESGFVEAKNGFICVSCGTSGRARCPSPEREPRARPLDPIDAVAKSRQPLGSQHSHPAGVRQAKFLITMPVFRPQRPAVYPPAEGRHVIVTGVPRGDRIPYLYHPTLPACGQVLSAPPQPLNSTATKSSRRRSRSKRSHLLRSRSPRQSGHPARRAIACAAPFGGPIPTRVIPARSSKPAILSPAACFASMTTGSASLAPQHYNRVMMPRLRHAVSCARSTESTSRFTIGSAIAITSSNEDCFRLP